MQWGRLVHDALPVHVGDNFIQWMPSSFFIPREGSPSCLFVGESYAEYSIEDVRGILSVVVLWC